MFGDRSSEQSDDDSDTTWFDGQLKRVKCAVSSAK